MFLLSKFAFINAGSSLVEGMVCCMFYTIEWVSSNGDKWSVIMTLY